MLTDPSSSRLGDKYELLEPIGEGGLGTVYRARESETGREVALKLLTATLTETRLARFLREGQVTATLQHPGIVRVHSWGEHAGRPYLVYELLKDCLTLREAIKGRPVPEIVAWVRDAARALGYAHQRGVLHRDVKPENLLIDSSGCLKVADFGLARVEGQDQLTRTGQALGTPGYMPAELLLGERDKVTPATDVWSLGAVLYEALCGERPFQGGTLQVIAARVIAGKYHSLRERSAEIPVELDAICRQALALNPQERYPQGEALARDLERMLRGEPVAALDRQKDKSRRRWATLAGGVGLALLLVAGVAFLWPRPGPDPAAEEATPPASAPPEALEEARAALLQGDPETALELVSSSQHPEAPVVRAEALLGLDRPAGALEQLSRLPESASRAELRARALLFLGRSGEALQVARAADSNWDTPGLQRVLGLGSVLEGRLSEARQHFAGAAEIVLVDLEEARLELERLNVSFATYEVDQDRVQAAVQELLEFSRRTLPLVPEIRAELLSRGQRAVVLLCVRLANMLANGLRRQEMDELLVQWIEHSPPGDTGVHQLNLARSWMRYRANQIHTDPVHRTLITADPRGWVDGLPEELHSVAHGMWFLFSPEERVPSGELAVSLKFYRAGRNAYRIQRTSMKRLIRIWRGRACEAYRAGDPLRAQEHRQRALAYGDPAIDLGVNDGLDASEIRAQVALTLLAGEEVERARGVSERIRLPALRGLLLAECELVAGRPEEALAFLEPLLAANPSHLEAWLCRVHARDLLSDRAGADDDLARAREIEASQPALLGVNWHSLDGLEELREGGWWPGQK